MECTVVQRYSLKNYRFQEKLLILMKMAKFDLFSVYILQNIKFSTEITYRSVIFIGKLQFSQKMIENFKISLFQQIPRI